MHRELFIGVHGYSVLLLLLLLSLKELGNARLGESD